MPWFCRAHIARLERAGVAKNHGKPWASGPLDAW